jgi:hypothetical protein
MRPGLDQNEVPTFWFCPHCVEKDLHIPPTPAETLSSTIPSTLSPESDIFNQQNLTTSPLNSHVSLQPVETSGSKTSPGLVQDLPSTAKSGSRPNNDHLPARRKTKKSSSPPRKKSKYSAFSVEVDKALSVLYEELETAAKMGKSEGHLQDKILSLEQQLKVQEGQLKIRDREFVFVREQLVKSREESDRLKVANDHFASEVANLRDMVQKKDAELKDWRAKLRTMVDSDAE